MRFSIEQRNAMTERFAYVLHGNMKEQDEIRIMIYIKCNMYLIEWQLGRQTDM